MANKRKHYCLTAGLPLFISVGPPAQCALGPIDHKKRLLIRVLLELLEQLQACEKVWPTFEIKLLDY